MVENTIGNKIIQGQKNSYRVNHIIGEGGQAKIYLAKSKD